MKVGCSQIQGGARPTPRLLRMGSATHEQDSWCRGTLVIPRTPMLGLDEVDPLPVPSSPAIMQQTPSVKIPL